MATTSKSFTNTQISQFNDKSYDYWAITMKRLFSSQNIWDLGGEWFSRTNKCNNMQCLASSIKGSVEEQEEEGCKTPLLDFSSSS